MKKRDWSLNERQLEIWIKKTSKEEHSDGGDGFSKTENPRKMEPRASLRLSGSLNRGSRSSELLPAWFY